jgi:hypothetical protein
MQQEIIKIHAVGMDERSCNTLSFFFEKFCNDQCEISEEPLAQAFLVNMDSVNAEAELARLKKTYPNHPLILTSIKPIDVSENHFLRKPMIADHLLTIIDKIRGIAIAPTKAGTNQIESNSQADNIKVSEQQAENKPVETKAKSLIQSLNDKDVIAFVGEAPDINLRQLQKSDEIFFGLDQYFLGFLQKAYQQAKAEQCAVRLTGVWRPITLFPEANQVYLELSDRQLKSICGVSLKSKRSVINEEDIKIESLEPNKATWQCKDHSKYQDLDLFMWKMALWTSRGRLPKGLPLDLPIYLLGWPNLTRLIQTPEALRICACWVPHPRTVINITEVLGAAQRYVFSFITATYILGLSGLASRQSDLLILPSDVEPTTKMNFFSRIMKRLKTKEI